MALTSFRVQLKMIEEAVKLSEDGVSLRQVADFIIQNYEILQRGVTISHMSVNQSF